MGRRSRAVEQVLGEVIEQAVSREHGPSRKSTAPQIDVAAAPRSRSSSAPAMSPSSRMDSSFPKEKSLPEEERKSVARVDDDENSSLYRATVDDAHPQFDTSLSVMHGIAHALKGSAMNRTLGDVDENVPNGEPRVRLPSDEPSYSETSSANGSVSLGQIPSFVFFKPDGDLTIREFREAVTHHHEVTFRIGKKGRPLGRANLSTRHLDGLRRNRSVSHSEASPPAVSSSPGKIKNRRIKFAFKTYAGAVFEKLRNFLDISNAEYTSSLAGGKAFLDFVSNSKSGQFFFFTEDRNYMIKTMSQQESIWFRLFLPDYYQHLRDHPNSLLVRIFGLYRLQVRGKAKLHFMVMRNVFSTPLPIHNRFDLKGSVVGRIATQAERQRPRDSIVLKDLDFDSADIRLHLGQKRDVIVEQIRSDAAFLSRTKLMDYSLLVGIYRRSQDDRAEADDAALLRRAKISDADALDGRGLVCRDQHGHIQEIYFLGIIDFLQKYNWRKKTEHFFKSLRYDSSEISAVSPKDYSNRFCNFIERHCN